jgi:hypothetical protein
VLKVSSVRVDPYTHRLAGDGDKQGVVIVGGHSLEAGDARRRGACLAVAAVAACVWIRLLRACSIRSDVVVGLRGQPSATGGRPCLHRCAHHGGRCGAM